MGAAIYVRFLCPMADTVLTLDVQRIDNRLRCAHHQVLGL